MAVQSRSKLQEGALISRLQMCRNDNEGVTTSSPSSPVPRYFPPLCFLGGSFISSSGNQDWYFSSLFLSKVKFLTRLGTKEGILRFSKFSKPNIPRIQKLCDFEMKIGGCGLGGGRKGDN